MTTTSKQEVAVSAPVVAEAERTLPTTVGSPFEEMERIFERLMPRGWLRPFRWDWPTAGELSGRLDIRIPAVDVIDQDGSVVVRAEMPGIAKRDIDVSATEHSITIKSKAKIEKREEEGEYFRCEISQSASSRTIPLPAAIDPTQVKAKLHDGILEVTMAKVNGARRHPIAIE